MTTIPEIYIKEANILEDYKPNPNILIDKRYLKCIHRLNYVDPINEPAQADEIYPFCNAYYQYTEDVDAVNRVCHYLDAKPSVHSIDKSSTSVVQEVRINEEVKDAYSEQNAHIKYLKQNPVCFLILGKPEIGEQALGKMLADYWNCVYIHPETLIKEEISSDSRAGMCIEFNLRCGRAVSSDVILRLLEKRLKSQSVAHRGFVLCGFPLICNDLYAEDPVSSESAIFNVHDIFDELIDNIFDQGLNQKMNVSKEGSIDDVEVDTQILEKSKPTDSDLILDVGFTTNDLCLPPEIGTNYEDQMQLIFDNCTFPLIIIYLKCSNEDVVNHRILNRFDPMTAELINLQNAKSDKLLYTVYARYPHLSEEVQDDLPNLFEDLPNRKLLKLQQDYPAHVNTQLERYRVEAHLVCEKYVLLHDPQYIIRLDGRITPSRMFNALKARLHVLPIQTASAPERIIPRSPKEEPGEGGRAVEEFNYEASTLTECFEHFHKNKIIGNLYKWSLSNWGFECPVSMSKGLYVQGLPQFAVHFMNKIYFLANDDAYIKFKTNPRPYLLPPFPRPGCRVFVLGPASSGRTAIAKCLCYVLNGDLLVPDKILEKYTDGVRQEFMDNCKSIAITNAIEQFKVKQKEDFVENERRYWESITEFLEDMKQKIKRKIEISQILEEFNTIEFSTFAMLTQKSKTDEIIEAEQELENINTYFDSINFPNTDDINENLRLYEDEENFIITFKPKNLTNLPVFNENSLDISSHHPFVQQCVKAALEEADYEFKNNPQISTDIVSKSFKDTFRDTEDKFRKAGISGGWVIDALPLNIELLDSFRPDYLADIIYIVNDEPGHEFLIEQFNAKKVHEFFEFRNLFLSLGMTDAAWRCPSNMSTTSYKQQSINYVLNDILDEVYEEKERHEKKELDDKGEEQDQEEGKLNEEDVIDESMLEAEEIEKQAIKDFQETHMPRESQRQYAKHLLKFDEEYELLIDWFNHHRINYTELKWKDGKSIKDLLLEVINNIDTYYDQLVSIFTPEDRIIEVEDSGEPRVEDEEMGGEDAETNEDRAEKEALFNANRRFGDTSNYCPLTYAKYWVLWKGKEEYALKYQNRLYFFCNEEAMHEFLPTPNKFLLRHNPPQQYPPPRICIVGSTGSGKTTLAKTLHRRFGLFNANYDVLIKEKCAKDKLEDYVYSDEPLGNTILDEVVKPYWFKEPYKSNGFIFDGFPRRPSDVDYMCKTACIPDLIIELSIPEYVLNERVSNKVINEWQIQTDADQANEEDRYKRVMDEWEINRKMRTDELLEIKKQERYAAKVSDVDLEDDTIKSQISYKSVEQAEDWDSVKMILDEELPEPWINYEWETLKQATGRLKSEVENHLFAEGKYINLLHEHCEAEQIPWISIDATLETLKVYNQAARVVLPLHTRTAIFERTYDISVDIAERLLTQGYYFLSQFGRSCPVQILEKHNPIQMITALELKFQIFPIIYRHYIYFLAGKDNRLKFKNDPIKYVNFVPTFPLIQIRIAVIGPPKCGKSSLAERLCEEYGFKHVSLGKAIRYVLKFLEHSALAKKVEKVLRAGDELSDELTIKCVEAMGFDGRALAQGIVMDGFPNNIYEVRELGKYNMVPHLIFDLQATSDNIHECTRFDLGKYKLVYSNKFIDLRHTDWLQTADYFRDWNYKEYQNLTKIPVDFTKWNVYTEANEILLSTVFEIKHYMKHAGQECALHISTMLITPLEFIQRQSSFKHFCPICLHNNNHLTSGGDPPDRTGLVQYKEYFYYLCQEHIEEFIDNPTNYIQPNNKYMLPEDIPIRVYLDVIPNNTNVNLNCNICYVDNKPDWIVNPGLLEFACRYKEHIYLFDTLECLIKFMQNPSNYFYVDYTASGSYALLNYQDIPTLGLLEQFDSMQLIKAVIDSHRLRPFVPGLDISQSALINIALYLKIHNPLTNPEYVPLYIEGKKRFLAHKKNLLTQLDDIKKEVNPYIHYEEPLPDMLCESVASAVPSSSNFSMIGIVDDMLNQIKYD